MLVFELRWFVFVFLLILVASILTALWLDRRLGRGSRRQPVLPDLARIVAATEYAPFGFVVLAGARSYRYANSYARHLLGLPSPRGQLPEAGWVQALDADLEAIRREGSVPGRYRQTAWSESPSSGASPTEDEYRQVIRWWVAPSGDLDLLFLVDVSAQERAERAAHSLINDVSHELRTPLATILTHLEVLSLPSISGEVGQQSIRLLKAEARRMARLVHLMLELGRLETSPEIERRPVELAMVVEQVVAQVSAEAEARGIGVSVEADLPLPVVMGDEDRLRQVFLNLLDNAVKYCRPGDQVCVSLRPDGEGVRCMVRDNGPGIPSKHLPHLTRRFYRAAPQETEGSGLGLAFVAEILRRHQSELTIASETGGPETGTSASFVLPAVNLVHQTVERLSV